MMWTAHCILLKHAPDELAYFLRHARSPTLTMTTLPRPQETKSLALPANDCVCFDHHQGTRHSAQLRDSQAQSQRSPAASLHRTLQHVQLITKRRDFHLQERTNTSGSSFPLSTNSEFTVWTPSRPEHSLGRFRKVVLPLALA